MPPRKEATLNLRINQVLKDAVRDAAKRDHRSIANLIELLIRKHCEEVGITIPEQSELHLDEQDG